MPLSVDHPLTISAAVDDDSPFVLAGARCGVLGCERAGIREVQFDGRRAGGGFALRDARAETFSISPLGIERGLVVHGGAVRERIVVAPHAAACIVEWEAGADVEFGIDSGVADTPDVMASWSDAAVLAGARLRAGEVVQVMIASANDSGSPRDSATHWLRVHAAEASRRGRDWLSVMLADPRLSTAFEWAKYRLANSRDLSERRLIALVNAGDEKTVRTTLARMRPDLAFLSVLARYADATGDTTTVRTHWPIVKEATSRYRAEMAPALAHSLAHAAESVGDTEFAHWLKSAVSVGARQPLTVPADQWVRNALLCFHEEKGAWPEAERGSAAEVVTGFADDILGLQPDAARARLRIRPDVPAGWTRLGVENIRLADAHIRLELERDVAHDRFVLSQAAGAFPVRLVFEPLLPAPLAEARIDGQAAELNTILVGDRRATQMQLVLDAPHIVELIWKKNPPSREGGSCE